MICYFGLFPIAMVDFAFTGIEPPEILAFDRDSLMTLLLEMLGSGGFRTAEKVKGLNKAIPPSLNG